MHEMALAEGTLAVALDASSGEPLRRVRIRVGQLQGILPESWAQCWQMATLDTPGAGSRSELVEEPAAVRCLDCGLEAQPQFPLACPACSSPRVTVLRGDSIVVEEVELCDGEVRRNPHLAQTQEVL